MKSNMKNRLQLSNVLIIFILFTIFFYFSFSSIAQTRKADLLSRDVLLSLPTIAMPTVNNDSLIQYYDSNKKNKSFVFAKAFVQNITTNSSGIWVKNKDDSYSWLCSISSAKAYSLSFQLRNCIIPQGAKLYILNVKNKQLIETFTTTNTNRDSTLFTEPIPGDTLVFELDMPRSTDISKSFLTIAAVYHDFRDFYKVTAVKRGLGNSGTCEYDINCGNGLKWQKEKHSIVQIIFSTKVGVQTCTGTLINNTSNNKVPYILTSNTCIKDAAMASSAIFYFNYENTICQGSDAQKTQFMTGSDLVATTKDSITHLDFTLLRLKTAIPTSFNPYYSGWSLKKDTVNAVTTLHHPKADALKISYSSEYIKESSFTSESGFLKNSHWQIAKWDTGVTESGSSGSPLFNANHQIIGILTGGDSFCGNPINDFFAKFSKAWNYYPDSTNQLQYWLDPSHTGSNELNGFKPLYINISSTHVLFDSSETKTTAITLSSNTSCTIHSDQSWLTVSPNVLASGTVTLSITATVNTGTERSATIIVSAEGATTQTITVTQKGETKIGRAHV